MDNARPLSEYRSLTVASLFSGAGGLDMGFENVGFKTLWANDIDKDACETHRLWSDAVVIQGDISKVDFNDVPYTDVITGGFPCQGFSLAGPRKLDDRRNSLYKFFVDLVAYKQPYVFVAENVKGILTLGDGAIIEAIIEDFSSRGYNVFPTLVNAADYGVPQDRWRVIMLGFRKDMGITRYQFAKPFACRVTMTEALRDMPMPQPTDICQGAFSPRYMSRNRKRQWNESSYTIPAMGKQVTLHPSSPDMCKLGEDRWQFGSSGGTRRFSWQEAAAIQTFPRNMEFAGDLTSRYKQIGNAVPVKLSEVVAQEVRKAIEAHQLAVLQGKVQGRTAVQTEMGKAFEYACLFNLYSQLAATQQVEIEETAAVLTARGFYTATNPAKRADMDRAARAAVRTIIRLEPQLGTPNGNEPLHMSIQEDARGIAGDVRDVLCVRRQNGWKVGFSCKHNHFAVKHSRLSQTIDFGKQWFGKACSTNYFAEITPIFAELVQLKRDGMLWRDIPDKEDRFYGPVLNAFVDELRRLDALYPSEVPAALITYLLGRYDFYKIIAKDSNQTTEIQAYNMFGSLNCPAGNSKPLSKVPQLRVPSKIFDVSFKDGSSNTIIITCDRGWAVSLRIHNASSRVEPSLKFDVNLIGTPNLGAIIEPW